VNAGVPISYSSSSQALQVYQTDVGRPISASFNPQKRPLDTHQDMASSSRTPSHLPWIMPAPTHSLLPDPSFHHRARGLIQASRRDTASEEPGRIFENRVTKVQLVERESPQVMAQLANKTVEVDRLVQRVSGGMPLLCALLIITSWQNKMQDQPR
jgi:hypothetical protein